MESSYKIDELTVSKAGQDDLPVLYKLLVVATEEKSFRNTQQLDMDRIEKEVPHSELAKEILQDGNEIFLISGPVFETLNPVRQNQDSQYYGFGMLRKKEDEMEISHLYTVKNPLYPAGSFLLGAILNEAKENNIRDIKVDSWTNDSTKWYKKAGFKTAKKPLDHILGEENYDRIKLAGHRDLPKLVLFRKNFDESIRKLETAAIRPFGNKKP